MWDGEPMRGPAAPPPEHGRSRAPNALSRLVAPGPAGHTGPPSRTAAPDARRCRRSCRAPLPPRLDGARSAAPPAQAAAAHSRLGSRSQISCVTFSPLGGARDCQKSGVSRRFGIDESHLDVGVHAAGARWKLGHGPRAPCVWIGGVNGGLGDPARDTLIVDPDQSLGRGARSWRHDSARTDQAQRARSSKRSETQNRWIWAGQPRATARRGVGGIAVVMAVAEADRQGRANLGLQDLCRTGALVSNQRLLACEATRSCGIHTTKYLRTRENHRAPTCPALGLIRPGTAGFGPTNDPTARPVPTSRRDTLRR